MEVICKELGQWLGTISSDTFLKPWTPKESSETILLFSYMKSLGFKEDNLVYKSPYKHRFIDSPFDCKT